jgi:tRNA-dihydrouridine synthase B
MQHIIYLAPLRGVTDRIFRKAFERYFGRFDYLVAPFITTVKGREVAASHIKDVDGDHNDRLRLIPQILGNDPDDFLLMAKRFHALGYRAVNWNLGCPHPQVTRKKRGCGLLPYPEIVGQFLQKVVPALEAELSVKVRLGLGDENELKLLMPVLNRFPISEVIIHPRTGKQMYTGGVNLDRFAENVDICRHPVVYNGDIMSPDDFSERQRRFPQVNRWMIGRGAVADPGLLSVLRGDGACRVDDAMLRRFHDDVFTENSLLLSGPAHVLGKMKGLWLYFSQNFQNGKKILKAIQRCSTIEQYRRKVDDAFTR